MFDGFGDEGERLVVFGDEGGQRRVVVNEPLRLGALVAVECVE